jgi:hydrogenase expression/formation protein HypD
LKFVDEFRDGETGRRLAETIRREAADRPMTFMEVCGTHTMSIARHGIRSLLPESIRLLSGPGCPVCVTPVGWIDHAVALARVPGVTLTGFGDMMRVPGSGSSLEIEASRGADVRVTASTLEALELAASAPDRRVVFLGVGFETTSPTVAVSVLEAARRKLTNFSVLCGHKLMPPALEALSADGIGVDGYLCPGHVSVMLGSDAYEPIVRNHGIGCVIAGFEPSDILQALLLLVRQVKAGKPAVENAYSRAVTAKGNIRAMTLLRDVFEPCDSEWRGLGTIQASGLAIRPEFSAHDAAVRIPVLVESAREPAGCRCGDVLRGILRPTGCGAFGKTCTPDHPMGACMVSMEGTCAAEFRYGGFGV